MSKLSKLSLVAAAVSLACLLIARTVLEGWIPALWVPLGLFLLFFIFPFVKDGGTFVSFFRMKTTKRGLSMGSLILLVMAILAVVNVIAVRHYKTWDWSAAQENTLSDQSIQLIKALDDDLKIIYFYKNGQEGIEENRRLFRELAKKYQDQSDRVRLDFVEVNERPDLAAEYGVNKGSGVVFLEYKGRRNRIEKVDEQEITSALVKVTAGKDKTVYYVVGHGEPDLEDTRDANGANAFKQLLTGNRYAVNPLPLATNPKIPADADLIAIVGPQQGFQEHEIAALEDYLKRGGSLWLALESKRTVGLEKILAKVGIVPENNYVQNVVETMMGKGITPGPTMGAVFSPESPVTKVFGGGEVVLFQNPMSLKRAAPVTGVTVDEIVKSPPGSMAFDNLQFKEEGPTGSYTFGLTAQGHWPGTGEKDKEFYLAVYGDAAFLSNAMLYQNLNRDLALNTAATLVREENRVSIAPREPGVTQLKLTDWGFRLFVWVFAIPLPLALLAIGGSLWARRRFA